MANIEDYEPVQVDAAHRISKKTATIIILFHKKSERQNFYKQKNKLYSLSASHYGPENREDHWDEED